MTEIFLPEGNMNPDLIGKTITLTARVGYPGSRVSDLYFGDDLHQIYNVGIRAALAPPPIAILLRKMMEANAIHENSWNKSKHPDWDGGQYDTNLFDAIITVADSADEARFLQLAGEWQNDIEELAKNYGIRYRWNDAEGNEVDMDEQRRIVLNPLSDVDQVPRFTLTVVDMTDEEKATHKLEQDEWEAEAKKELAELQAHADTKVELSSEPS